MGPSLNDHVGAARPAPVLFHPSPLWWSLQALLVGGNHCGLIMVSAHEIKGCLFLSSVHRIRMCDSSTGPLPLRSTTGCGGSALQITSFDNSGFTESCGAGANMSARFLFHRCTQNWGGDVSKYQVFFSSRPCYANFFASAVCSLGFVRCFVCSRDDDNSRLHWDPLYDAFILDTSLHIRQN